MSQVKQVGLLAAGCQPWNKDVCAASGDRFAYCATLAIYVYQVNPVNDKRETLFWNLDCLFESFLMADRKQAGLCLLSFHQTLSLFIKH